MSCLKAFGPGRDAGTGATANGRENRGGVDECGCLGRQTGQGSGRWWILVDSQAARYFTTMEGGMDLRVSEVEQGSLMVIIVSCITLARIAHNSSGWQADLEKDDLLE